MRKGLWPAESLLLPVHSLPPLLHLPMALTPPQCHTTPKKPPFPSIGSHSLFLSFNISLALGFQKSGLGRYQVVLLEDNRLCGNLPAFSCGAVSRTNMWILACLAGTDISMTTVASKIICVTLDQPLITSESQVGSVIRELTLAGSPTPTLLSGLSSHLFLPLNLPSSPCLRASALRSYLSLCLSLRGLLMVCPVLFR